MCLALLALDVHPRYAVVIAANRDEFHDRPTAPAAWWDEGWLAGRDLRAGGTWLGITRRGRFALLTNVREPERKNPDAPSRGSLVPAVLADALPVTRALEVARDASLRHNGYNLLAGTAEDAAWTSNRAPAVRALVPGIYGLSNALLDSPWPKLMRSKAALADWVARGGTDAEPLFETLADRTLAPDAELPSTGVAIEWERRLSAPFIVSDAYGTRSSTLVTVDREGHARFVERSFDAKGVAAGQVEHRFRVVTRPLTRQAAGRSRASP